jgi:hypothetical protein
MDRVLGVIHLMQIEKCWGLLRIALSFCLTPKGGFTYPAHSTLDSSVLNGMHRALHPPYFKRHKVDFPPLSPPTNLHPSQINYTLESFHSPNPLSRKITYSAFSFSGISINPSFPCPIHFPRRHQHHTQAASLLPAPSFSTSSAAPPQTPKPPSRPRQPPH